MPLSTYLLFLPACFAVNLAFGPNNLLAITNGARHGPLRALAAAGGRLLAFALMIAVAGIGMGTLLLASEWAFNAVKWAGAAYLLYLGVKLLRADAPVVPAAGDATAVPLAKLTRQEFAVAIGNPKAILVFTAFFPQFVVADAYAWSYLLMGATFLVLEAVAIAVYAALGARMGRLARGGNSRRLLRWFNRISGSFMVGFAVLLAVARRPVT